ncbi:MAG: hypothetical protein JW795_17735 [Chitinivibrionales bacterium]|nr:hypothetical protein [Chitinivibrionales bacterium]
MRAIPVLLCLCLPLLGALIPFQIPADHPRVYIRPQQIMEIKNKLTDQQFSQDWANVKKSDHPLCLALRSLIANDTAAGRRAIATCLSQLKSCTDGRREYSPFHYGACVYDWCYPLLTPDEKASFIREFVRIAAIEAPWYPAKDSGTVYLAGHTNEGWLLTGQLPVGVAIYNENRTMFDAASALFNEKFLPGMNFYYSAHMHHQGNAYCGRFVHDLFATWLFAGIGYPNIFSKEQRFVAYQMLYHDRPDRKMFRMGDSFEYLPYPSDYKMLITMLAANYYNDPYLLYKHQHYPSRGAVLENVFYLITKKASLSAKPLTDLPTAAYFPSPSGEIIFRTGWDFSDSSADAAIQMRIGEYYFDNHQAKDFGTFQLYYKGALAITTGFYDYFYSNHQINYSHQTIAHNGLLIHDPSEKMKYRSKDAYNDGGQKYIENGQSPYDLNELLAKYKAGSVYSRQIDQLKECRYSYISGNITATYSSKVSIVRRSMVAFKTGNRLSPALFFVFDKITAKNPSFTKKWLLHSVPEPVIQDRRVSILNDLPKYNRSGNFDYATGQYHGKLILDCLLPKQARIHKIGGKGKEFLADTISSVSLGPSPEDIAANNPWDTIPAAYESGVWRLEISPVEKSATDNFLNVMALMDKETTVPQQATLIETDSFIGAQMLNHMALFSRSGSLQQEVKVPVGTEQKNILLCDLKPGTWYRYSGRSLQSEYTVSDTGKCLYLTACTGELLLSRTRLLNRTISYGSVQYAIVLPSKSAQYQCELSGLDNDSILISKTSSDTLFQAYPLRNGLYRFSLTADTFHIVDTFSITTATALTVSHQKLQPFSFPDGTLRPAASNDLFELFDFLVDSTESTDAISKAASVSLLSSKPVRLINQGNFISINKNFSILDPARGYWLQQQSDKGLTIGFNSATDFHTHPMTISLDRGWNQIGSAYIYPVQWPDTNAMLWRWNPHTRDYEACHTLLEPWSNYFIFEKSACKRTVSPELFMARPAHQMPLLPGATLRYIQVTMIAGDLHDENNFFGTIQTTANGTHQPSLVLPPRPQAGIELTFCDASGRPISATTDIRPSVTGIDRFYILLFNAADESVAECKLVFSGIDSLSNTTVMVENRQASAGSMRVEDGTAYPVTLQENRAELTITVADSVVQSMYTTLLLPKKFFLKNICSNPTHSSVVLHYAIPNPTKALFDGTESVEMTLSIFDIKGRVVRTLVNGKQAPGYYTTTWNTDNTVGNPVASGTYFIMMQSGSFRKTTPITVLK